MLLRFLLLAIVQLWVIDITVGVVPQIQKLNVQCDRTGMRVNVEFDTPFNGIIFSKGHYSDRNCRYVSPNTRRLTYSLFIPSTSCGTIQTDARRDGTVGFKNVIIIQNDPEFQEVWDMARKISCDWVTRINKYVTFAPFGVDMLGIKEIKFPGDTVDCWMDIQRGHGPFAPTIAGVVPIGEKLTIVIYIRDRDSSFDIHVKDCYAYDSPDYKRPGVRAIQLTDVRGCPIKEKLVKGFYRTRDVRNSGATIIAYGVINAFKFPEAMDVFLACNVEVCKGGCENQCQPEVAMAGGDSDGEAKGPQPDTQQKVEVDDEEESPIPTSTAVSTDNEVPEETPTGGGEEESSEGGTTGTEEETPASGGEETPASGGEETPTSGGEETPTSGGEDSETPTDTETTNENESTESETTGNGSEATDESPSTDAPSEATDATTEAGDTDATSEDEESRRAASSPVRVAVKSRAKKSSRRSASLKTNAKLKSKLKAKPKPKPKPKGINVNTRKRKRLDVGRGKRSKRSIIITGLNGTFPRMTHSISILSPVEDFDENELEIWQRAKEGDNKVCFSALSLITSSLILTGLAILFSVSLLLSYGRIRQRYGQKSFS